MPPAVATPSLTTITRSCAFGCEETHLSAPARSEAPSAPRFKIACIASALKLLAGPEKTASTD